MAKKTESELIKEVERRLAAKFTAVPSQRIAAAVQIAHTRFENSVIRDFVPLLVERRVAGQLAQFGDADHAPELATTA